MGPRLFSRGRTSRAPYVTGPIHASMGPRLFSRGRRLTQRLTFPSSLASMGPRLFSRGRLRGRHGPHHDRLTLQWGRGSSAAEGSFVILLESPENVLQWGRGSSAAEGKKLVSYVAGSAPLQWGRGSSAAEGRGPADHLQGRHPASMGPRLFSRGRAAVVSTPEVVVTSFNGAADLQPRKGPKGQG